MCGNLDVAAVRLLYSAGCVRVVSDLEIFRNFFVADVPPVESVAGPDRRSRQRDGLAAFNKATSRCLAVCRIDGYLVCCNVTPGPGERLGAVRRGYVFCENRKVRFRNGDNVRIAICSRGDPADLVAVDGVKKVEKRT